ncbi:MAG: V-type ATP synthase subunit F [Christensenellales bacterium]|jgi:V/A-type H+-transporting ATPase subunit F
MADKRVPMGVIGESDAIKAFRTVGMQVMSAATQQEAERAVHHMLTNGVTVIFITEDVARQIPDTLARYNGSPEVTLIPIPGSRGSTGFGMQRVQANVEKAVGANILLNNTEE